MAKHIILIGAIQVNLVKVLSYSMGNTVVGHAVGKGVRLNQTKASREPKKIQMRCSLIDTNKYVKRLALEVLYDSKIPFPFVSGLAGIPLTTIENLTFSQSSDRKTLEGDPVIEFVITLQEYRTNLLLSAGVKIAWLAWVSAIYADPATKVKLITSEPDAYEESAVITDGYIIGKVITEKTQEDLEIESTSSIKSESWTSEELLNANILNRRFDKLPIDQNGIFPQSIKLSYPSSSIHYSSFNDIKLPDNYDGYTFPEYNISQTTQFLMTFVAKETTNGSYITMTIKDEDRIPLFSRKIVTGVRYKIGIYEFTFNELDVKTENINPVNKTGGNYGSKFEGGIRIT